MTKFGKTLKPPTTYHYKGHANLHEAIREVATKPLARISLLRDISQEKTNSMI